MFLHVAAAAYHGLCLSVAQPLPGIEDCSLLLPTETV